LANHSYRTAHIERCCQSLLPEGLVNALPLEGQHTDSYAAYLPMTDSEEASIGSKYLDEVTFL
jgi:hypothetical protein